MTDVRTSSGWRRTNTSGDCGKASRNSGIQKSFEGILSVKCALSPPSNLQVHLISATQLDLSWTNNHTHGIRIEVQRRTAQTEWTDAGSVSIGSTSFSDTGRVSGVTYLYRVRVNGSYADSSWSNEASGTTP